MGSNKNLKEEGPYLFVRKKVNLVTTLFRIRWDDVMYVEWVKDYYKVCCCDGMVYVLHGTIGSFLERVSGKENFVRCHKSYVVNMDYVKSVVDGMTLMLYNDSELGIPLGRTYEDDFYLLTEIIK